MKEGQVRPSFFRQRLGELANHPSSFKVSFCVINRALCCPLR